MTKSELDAIRARADAATLGPWRTTTYEYPLRAGDPLRVDCVGPLQAMCDCGEEYPHAQPHIDGGKADIAFVTAARVDVPALCDALEAAMLALRIAEGLLDSTDYHNDMARVFGQELLRDWRCDHA